MNKKLFFICGLFTIILFSCIDKKMKFQTYTSKSGGFSIYMPEKLKFVDMNVVTAFGKQKVYFVTWRPDNLSIESFKLFQVSYTDYPFRMRRDSLGIRKMLDSSMNMRIRDFTNQEVVHFEPISLNGYPGTAFIYDKPADNVVIVKQCIANNKLYDLTVVLKKNFKTNIEVNQFYNSFTVLRN